LFITLLINSFISKKKKSVIIGLTQFSDRRHIARATLEAVCFQTKEVFFSLSLFFFLNWFLT